MPETITTEDNLNNGPASVPPFPGSEHDRLNKVEIKTDNLLQDFNVIKIEIIDNSKAIDRLKLSVDGLKQTMDDRFAAQEKTMNNRFAAQDDKFVALEKTMDNRFAALEKTMNNRFTAQDDKFAALEKIMNNRFAAQDDKFAALEKILVKVEEKMNNIARTNYLFLLTVVAGVIVSGIGIILTNLLK
ncbi:MAG: hypothetical protein LBJ61_11830 [Deltaproteobacteria bacterium]|nr:hypothetical protein [Deltaproteobacteria bacterium]